MEPIRWGVLSTAGIGIKAMLPALSAASNCELRAIASRQRDRAGIVARQFGIGSAYGSYDELLADPEIDAVYNPLPNHLHVPVTIQALKAGKHVLCEKPLAMTEAEARQVAEAASAAGRQVAEAFMICHHPQWVRARDLLREGRIGKPSAIQVLFSYSNTDPENVRNKPDIGGGGLYDIGCYAVRAGRWLFGSEPEAVCAVMDRDPAFGTDRLTSGMIRFPDGAHLSFTVATQSALAQQMMILGAEGYMLFDAPFNCPPDHAARLVIDDGSDLLGKGRQVEILSPANQYQLQAKEFSRAIRSGETALNGPADAICNAATTEALTRAAESGGWEPVTT